MISEGVKVSVETFYQQDYSNPRQSEYMFAYRVTIENKNPFPVKLEGRKWHIFDALPGRQGRLQDNWEHPTQDCYRIVEGEVVRPSVRPPDQRSG